MSNETRYPEDKTTFGPEAANAIIGHLTVMQHCLQFAGKAHGRRKLADMEDALGLIAQRMEMIDEVICQLEVDRPAARSVKKYDELSRLYG